ncbi:hypothetical protein BU24DRAFT_14337 [Aaosphaeria arxii CBS 175.79]|uniref:DUF7730 domain-containing protein n=1 Tax=Aaosphaeria arxii CBS 175.79 TaxID=1450172 RepID=A0A6A5Y910_9PLEO|nr:uncharacterized protein BU24DRAFT_14337 [Aaosphaeria arxii CBS 175.79]KAF2021074.1 hypothetical protein BU24DRAFT_14337 [Aaosphaeria arxii CBS 175.79]
MWSMIPPAMRPACKSIGKVAFWIAVSPAIIILFGFYIAYSLVVYLCKEFDEWMHRPSRQLLEPQEIESRRAKREARYRARPLPRFRERAMTLDSNGGLSLVAAPVTGRKEGETRRVVHSLASVRQTTTDQLGVCDLYIFPYEIREMIWQYALGGHHIHIVKRKGKLGSIYCPANGALDLDHTDLCCLSRDQRGYHTATGWPSHARPLSLLGSCRQIYSESINFLYSSNTFSFDEFSTLIDFFPTLIPKRRALISSVHMLIDFAPSCSSQRLSPFAHIYTPHNDSLADWQQCTAILKSLPALTNVTITSPFFWIRNMHLHRSRPATWIQDFFTLLNEVRVHGQVSLVWPPVPNATYVGDVNSLLPANHSFKLYPSIYHDGCELLAFILPLHVACLHCEPHSIIRKMTKGLAESRTDYRIDNESATNPIQLDPWRSRYWTFHASCRGWIEFEYDWEEKRWSVTQGAKELTDDEANAHMAETGQVGQNLESMHGIMQGLWVKSSIMNHAAIGDTTGKALDIPTKEAFYRNAGWTEV